jgi:hypothetical protein
VKLLYVRAVSYSRRRVVYLLEALCACGALGRVGSDTIRVVL